MMRVAVIGSTGQLGTDLVEVLDKAGHYHVVSLSHMDLDCTDTGSARRVLKKVHPDVVVNCAAFVRVDDCEEHTEEAFRINALGAFYVARACAEINALCVYISTDYVFDGEKGEPYTEEDLPCPINVYGTSKLAGEYLVRQTCPQWLIVRMASLFGKAGARGKGGNFVESILAKARKGEALEVVNDIRMSPTYTHDAALALERLLRKGATGLFHLTNAGTCTWYDFARTALDLARLEGQVESISSRGHSSRARRPSDSTLISTQLSSSIDEYLPPWQEALKAYLVEKGYRNSKSQVTSRRLSDARI